MTSKDLSLLNPRLHILCIEFLSKVPNAIVTETWRDPAREDQLHAQGITPATGKTCKHCCLDDEGKPASKAFDFLLLDKGKIISDGTDPRYSEAGQIGKALGLTWGGDFHKPDYDHFEIA